MADEQAGFNWARRVQQELIRRLYTLDAKGVQDDELLTEVGYAVYARCESIRVATEAHAGRATCRHCRAAMPRHGWERDKPLVCGECGWPESPGDLGDGELVARLLELNSTREPAE